MISSFKILSTFSIALSFLLFPTSVHAQQFQTNNYFVIQENGLIGDNYICYLNDGFEYEMALVNPVYQEYFELVKDYNQPNCYYLQVSSLWNCCINPGLAFEISLTRQSCDTPTVECMPGYSWDTVNCQCVQEVICGAEQSCTMGNTWSWESCSCVSTCSTVQACSPDYSFNFGSCSCEYTGTGSGSGCSNIPFCASDQIWNEQTCSCDSCTMLACDANSQWNSQTCTCDPFESGCTNVYPCLESETWNSQTCTCESVPVTGCSNIPFCASDQTWNSQTCACESVPVSGCSNIPFCTSDQVWNEQTCACESVPVSGCQETVCEFANTYWDSSSCSCVMSSGSGGSSGEGGGSGENNPIINQERRQRRLQNSIQETFFATLVKCTGKTMYTCTCCGSDSQCTGSAQASPSTVARRRSLLRLEESAIDTRILASTNEQCSCPSDMNPNINSGIFYSMVYQQYVHASSYVVACPTPTASPSPVSVTLPSGDCNYAYLGYFVITLQPFSQGPFRMAVKLTSALQGEVLIIVFNVNINNFRDGKMYQFLHLYQIGSEIHFILNSHVYDSLSVIYRARISDFIYIHFIGDGTGQHEFDFYKDQHQNFPYLINPEVYDVPIQAGNNYEILFNDLFYVINCVSPSSSPSPSRTPSSSITPSITSSRTPSITPSITPSRSTTPSPTPSITPSVSNTPSSSPTQSFSPTPTITPTPSPSPSCVWSALSCDPTGQFCTLKNTQNPCVTPTPITQPSQIPGIRTIRIRTPKTMRVF
jgi:hypothetical protein